MASRKKLSAAVGAARATLMGNLSCAIRYSYVSSCNMIDFPRMSRVRTRPTRDETREKLFQAAAEVFEEHGIGAASIEMIAAAAGLTRGAFYSNFEDKDDLIIAMLEDHVDRSIRHHRELLARHRHQI